MSDEKKIGAYICKGCGLGERLEEAQLATIAQRDGKANVVREHDILCSEEGVAMIQNDIDNEGVNRIAICACSTPSPNIIRAVNLFRSGGGIRAMALPFSFSCSSMVFSFLIFAG